MTNTSNTYEWAALTSTSAASYQKGSIKKLLAHIDGDSPGYEIIRAKCIPYYDFDLMYESQEEQERNMQADFEKAQASVQMLFPQGNILGFSASGYSTKKDTWKNSFHFRVRGAGWFPCGKALPLPENTDESVYRDAGMQQKFRLPYCTKDGDRRVLKRTLLVDDQLQIIDQLSDCPEKLEDYLVTNISGENKAAHSYSKTKVNVKRVRVKKVKDNADAESEPEPDKPFSLIDEVQQLSLVQLTELVETCFVPDETQEWDRAFHRNFVWCLRGIQDKFKIDTQPLALRVSAMSVKHGTSKKGNTTEYLFGVDREKYGNTFGLGWLCNQARRLAPEPYTQWMCKNRLAHNTCFLSDYLILQRLPKVTFRDILFWAKQCITVIDNGGQQIILTKNKFIDDPLTPDLYSIKYKDTTMRNLIASLDVRIKFHDDAKTDSGVYGDVISDPSIPIDLAEFMRPEREPEPEPEPAPEPAVMTAEAVTKIVEAVTKKKKKKPKPTKPAKAKKGKKLDFNNLGVVLKVILQHRMVPTFNAIDFIPWGVNEKKPYTPYTFNMFQGFRMSRYTPTKVVDVTQTLYYKHFTEQLCPEAGAITYCFDWFATMLQRPREHCPVGLVFISDQGNGKDKLATLLKDIMGEEYFLGFENIDSYFGSFNSEQRGKLLFKMNELAEGGKLSKAHDRYKGEMTKTEQWIEPKGIDKYKVRAFGHYLHFTQHRNAVTVERSDRRFTIVECKNDHANEFDYWRAISNELEDLDVVHAWYKFFCERDLSDARIQQAYTTQIKNKLKEQQMPASLRFLISEANPDSDHSEGDSDSDEQKTPVYHTYSGKGLFSAYKDWCDDEEPGANKKKANFDNWMTQLGLVCKPRRIGGKTIRCYRFTTNELQDLFRKYLKNPEFQLLYDQEVAE